jgi:isopenicillin N synthase-like dioxygenase
MNQIPIIDCTPLFTSDSFSSNESLATISKIDTAFRTWGIFILTATTPIPPELTNSLCATLDKFFLLPDQKKDLLHLKNGGLAWRGYMPWGGEGTKGSTDQKEGFYGRPELNHKDEHSLKGIPTYGENQFPDEDIPEMRTLVLEYIGKITELGLIISDAMSVGLGFEKGEVRRRFLEPEPIQLFRSFKYSAQEGVKSYGIGEHSDFGFLTLLSQNAPGLQVLSPSNEWVDVPAIPDSFVVNGELLFCNLSSLITDLII